MVTFGNKVNTELLPVSRVKKTAKLMSYNRKFIMVAAHHFYSKSCAQVPYFQKQTPDVFYKKSSEAYNFIKKETLNFAKFSGTSLRKTSE